MPEELTIKITGEAGQGMQTVGSALCRIYKDAGFHLFANQDYMSRIRGGNNFYQLRISNKPLYSLRNKSDITVALDKESVELHRQSISDNGIMVLDKEKFSITSQENNFFDVPLYKIAKNTGGSEIFVNSVACGVVASLTGIGFPYVEKIIRAVFSDKTEEIIGKNIDSSLKGYDFAKNNFKDKKFSLKAVKPDERFLINGNEAIALGAIKAGCKFYCAYPMTPSTSIMNTIEHYAKDFNILVEQAEDEIAAVNMVIGASFAGVRSMASTSGGGFALMVEGLSLAGMTETPIVLADIQRPAPATGLPTRTEQADLNFILNAGHGEFARVVFTPGSIEECFYLTQKAFNIAEKFQIPVLILSDQYLADYYRDINKLDYKKIKVERHLLSKEESKNISDYLRYRFTDSGVSPRAVPGWINGVIYADSDEHSQAGHITEDADIRKKMVEKRLYKKMALLLQEVEAPTYIGPKDAQIIFAGFGSTYGVIKEALENIANKKAGFIHFSQVWPFPQAAFRKIAEKAKKIITIENNASAQLARLIRAETGVLAKDPILKYDGRPFDLDYLIRELKQKV